MIKSMTGFGRAEVQDSERKITIELKSVNHRYLDFNFKIPKKLIFFESVIRSALKEYMQRGKIDVFISYEDYTKSRIALQYNREMAGQYLRCFKQMEDDHDLNNDITITKLARFPEILVMAEQPVDEQELWTLLEPAVHQAAAAFAASRQKEGEVLLHDLEAKLTGMTQKVALIEARAPQIIEQYRQKIATKTKELLADAQIEESRIAAEVVLFADKICTDEESVRLRSHIENTRRVLADGESVGRKLDFIAQEMNREANTILSKANDLETSNIAIDLKTEIEKVREQIQNIE